MEPCIHDSIGRWYGKRDSFAVSFAGRKKPIVRLGQALAGGARPRRILLFESLSSDITKKQTPKRVSAFLVSVKG